MLDAVLIDMLQRSVELYNLFTENESFRNWLRNQSFSATYYRE